MEAVLACMAYLLGLHGNQPSLTYLPLLRSPLRCSEPQFSNADRSCLWELTSLAAHVHPSGRHPRQAMRMGCCAVLQNGLQLGPCGT